MATPAFAYSSEFTQRYVDQGRAEGKAESVLPELAARGIEISDAVRDRVMSCTDPGQLAEWLRRAATAHTTDDLFGP